MKDLPKKPRKLMMKNPARSKKKKKRSMMRKPMRKKLSRKNPLKTRKIALNG